MNFVLFLIEKANASPAESFWLYNALFGGTLGIVIATLTWLLERITGPDFRLLSPETSTAVHALFGGLSWLLVMYLIYRMPELHGDMMLTAAGLTSPVVATGARAAADKIANGSVRNALESSGILKPRE